MSYVDSAACQMLATHCCCCGRPLVDATSVELGIGPECRAGETGGVSDENRVACNKLTYEAATAAQAGNIVRVREIAEQIAAMGLTVLASKITGRFTKAEKNAKVTITQNGDILAVKTPFKRSASQDFIDAWRNIPGRRWGGGVNLVPVSSKPQLWFLLRKYFGGQYGMGPQGVFRIPELPEVAEAA